MLKLSMNQPLNKQTKLRGFTLIELLVVIAIIGILASVTLASLNDARAGARDSSVKQSVMQLISQAELFRIRTDPSNPNFSSLRKYSITTSVQNRTCVDRNIGNINPFGPKFLELCQSIENLVPHPTNSWYMYWGIRTRVGAGSWSWSNSGFAVTVRLNSGDFFCANTNGAVKQASTITLAVSGCRDITL